MQIPQHGVKPARLLTFGAFALAGLIFWTSFHTAQGTNLRTDDSQLRLSDLIHQRDRQNARLDRETAALRGEIDDLARDDTRPAPDAQRRRDTVERAAGTKKLKGAGLSVTLTDAPPDATPLIPDVPDPLPDDLVIHQHDLQAVVNALWAGGAKGIEVMGQRLISTSAVRCVGNTLILQGRVYSPPYTITAVGDRGKLQRALDDSEAIEMYMRYVEAYGLGWKVARHDAVTLPAYSGTVDLHHAEPVTE